MKKTIFFIGLLFILTACKEPLLQQQSDAKHQPIAKNAWIEITQKVRVAPDHARAFFQGGKWINPSDLNLYQVNCELEVRQVMESDQWILPGKFKIIKTRQDQSPIVFIPGMSIDLAWVKDQAPSDIKRFWIFTLQSKQQDNVMHFICRGAQDSPYNATLTTAAEMQAAVGNNIQLHLF